MKTILLLVCLLGTLPAVSQSIVGTWKRTGTTITYQSGKTEDVQPMMVKSVPCTARVTYEFTSNGMLKTHVPADCKQLLGPMVKISADTRYAISGNKITVESPDPQLSPTMTQTYAVQGNTLTMTFTYADQPNVPNPNKAKSVVMTYQKL